MKCKYLLAVLYCVGILFADKNIVKAGYLRTDVEPTVELSEEPSDETSESEEIDGEDPSETEPEIIYMEVEGNVPAYQKGDLPFVIIQDDIVISYNIIHADGTVDQLTEAGYNTYFERYIAKTGDQQPHFGSTNDFIDERSKIVKQNAGSEDEMMLALAIPADTLTAIPSPDAIKWFFIEKDDVTHYVYYSIIDQKYYETSEDLYNHYIQLDKNWFTNTQLIDNGSPGYGNITLMIEASKRLQGETLVVTVMSYQDGEEKSALVNSPYNVTLALETGKYKIEEINLYDDADFYLDFECPEFTVLEYQNIIVPVKAYDPMDLFEIQQMTAEQAQEANAQFYEGEAELKTTVPIAEVPDVASEQPQKGISKWAYVAGGLVVLLVCGVGYIIWQKKQYEY